MKKVLRVMTPGENVPAGHVLTERSVTETISIAIIDHPKNPGYPTYWHARGYGLFAANPLGQKAFSGGKEELNLTLKQGEKAVFRYRIIIHSGDILRGKTDRGTGSSILQN